MQLAYRGKHKIKEKISIFSRAVNLFLSAVVLTVSYFEAAVSMTQAKKYKRKKNSNFILAVSYLNNLI